MAKKKVSRKELLKGPDEFLTVSARAVMYFKEHSRQFSYLGAAVVLGILIYLGINFYMSYIDKKGQIAYNRAYYSLSKDKDIEPKTEKDNLKEVALLFEKVRDKYGLSKASRLALPELANLNYLGNDYDKAISYYREYLKEVPEDPAYQSLAKLAMASCYEEQKEYEESIDLLNQILSVPNNFFSEQAMLNLARVYRLSNQQEKSGDVLKEFVEKFPSSPFLPVAKAYLDEYESQ
jgi:outer membrane protein assembly factor BamD (BamD/ComL family)